MYQDQELLKAQEEVWRFRQKSVQREELLAQERELEKETRELYRDFQKEESDVDALEGHGLAVLFFTVTGRLDERLEKERAEAHRARLKYQTAQGELENVRRDRERLEAELQALDGCEERLAAAFEQKKEALRESGGPLAGELLEREERLSYIEHQKKELEEARAAGREALSATERLLKRLNSARDWGTVDLMGGGFLSSLAKHQDLDQAQEELIILQGKLRRFKTELADVELTADFQVSLDGFLRFADYFFDGIFVDWAVQSRIKESLSRVQSVKQQIESVLNRLRERETDLHVLREETRKKLEALLLETRSPGGESGTARDGNRAEKGN